MTTAYSAVELRSLQILFVSFPRCADLSTFLYKGDEQYLQNDTIESLLKPQIQNSGWCIYGGMYFSFGLK
mgnify:CR=1 FL=1